MGATSTRPAFTPRKLLTAVVDQYEQGFHRNGTVQVTYEIISVRGVKEMKGSG
jgi:hypothetical protein